MGRDDDIQAHQASASRESDSDHDRATTEKFGTPADQKDMYRMGKTQRLRRNFGFFSIFGFSMILLSTWETLVGTAFIGLGNGGTAGMIYMYISVAFGMGAVVLSMAEMASMAPTAGGQYHWVSEFSPRSAQRFLSYVVGWLCVLGWQTGSASSSFLAALEIEGLIILNHDGFVPHPWHVTLLAIAVTGICGIFNTFLARKLPLVEGAVLILHVVGFFAIMIPLWVLAPRSPAERVFTEFVNPGWATRGVACLVGILSPTVSLLGSDAATHMSEEVQDASYVLPRAMIATAIFNGTLGFVMLLTLTFTIGDVEAALNSPVGMNGTPFIHVFSQGVQSVAGATVMTCIMIVLSTFCAITNIATASRQLFAFGRDHGVPFSSFFSHVPEGWDIPLNSVVLTMIVSTILALINLGSSLAYNIITSLGVAALLSSYIFSISCVCIKRWRNEPLLPRRFSLGRWGFPINVFSVLFLLMVFTLCFFPPMPNPTPRGMNWSSVIYSGVMIFSLVYFYVKGRKVYQGPVEYVRKTE